MKQLTCCILAIFILLNGISVDGGKSPRRGGSKTKSHAANADHVRLSYGQPGPQRTQSHVPQYPRQQEHNVQQSHVPQSHASPPYPVRPSAPELPKAPAQANPPPAGWAVGHSDTVQKQSASNTNTGFHANPPPPYPVNPVPNHNNQPIAPPAYSPSAPVNTQQHYPAGAPPPYTQNTGANGHPGK